MNMTTERDNTELLAAIAEREAEIARIERENATLLAKISADLAVIETLNRVPSRNPDLMGVRL